MKIDEVKELTNNLLFQNYGRETVCFERGEREFLFDLNGRRYIDFVAGIAVNALGHAHPDVIKTVCEQSKKLMHVSNLYLIQEQAALAKVLASIVPQPLGISMYVNSGAEANETGLKLAVKHTKRGRIVSTRNSFHGRTAAPLAATGQPKYQSGFEPLLSKAFDFIDYGSTEQMKEAVTSDTAAIILEPIQGEGGIVVPSEEFMRATRDVCTDKGALLIMDEVQTGLGRTGRMFGFQHFGIVPDIVTLAKALGGGFPIGAVVTSGEIARTFTPGTHGSTFGGNPLACAVASTVIKVMVSEKLPERAERIGGEWLEHLRGLQEHSISEVRGKGLMIGVEMDENARDFQKFAFSKGLLVNVCAGKVVRLVPPLIIGEDSIGRFNDVLSQYLRQN
jgi:acetylornithine/N-succinyldiaminopimelate aminotransferase